MTVMAAFENRRKFKCDLLPASNSLDCLATMLLHLYILHTHTHAHKYLQTFLLSAPTMDFLWLLAQPAFGYSLFPCSSYRLGGFLYLPSTNRPRPPEGPSHGQLAVWLAPSLLGRRRTRQYWEERSSVFPCRSVANIPGCERVIHCWREISLLQSRNGMEKDTQTHYRQKGVCWRWRFVVVGAFVLQSHQCQRSEKRAYSHTLKSAGRRDKDKEP